MRSKRAALIAPVVLALAAMPAMAQNNGITQDEAWHDARLEGYTSDNGGVQAIVIKEGGSTAGTWFMTAVLGVLCFGVMCKNGKRTHLD